MMSEEEQALKILEIEYKQEEYRTNKICIEDYFYFLEKLKEHKSETIKGKIQELYRKFDEKTFYCEHDKNLLIDNIRAVIEEE